MPLMPRACAVCHAVFQPTRATARYCSAPCRREAKLKQYSAYNARRYERAPEPRKAASRAYRAANREKLREYFRDRYRANPARARARSLKRYFGLTLAEYEAMVTAHAGLCAICAQPETVRNQSGRIKPLAVDHDHATGAIRGLLCQSCNTGLGYLGDSRARLLAAIAYLDRYATPLRLVG